MKVRSGFVSNSSSSSFIIYGAWIDEDTVKGKLTPEDLEAVEEDSYLLSEVAEDMPMFYHRDPYGNGCAFGRSYTSIGDNETGGQFKKDVEDELEELFGKKIKCERIKHTYQC